MYSGNTMKTYGKDKAVGYCMKISYTIARLTMRQRVGWAQEVLDMVGKRKSCQELNPEY
jgi:hypothetical protein